MVVCVVRSELLIFLWKKYIFILSYFITISLQSVVGKVAFDDYIDGQNIVRLWIGRAV